LENVLKMIGAKRATIFPLRVAGAVAFSNGDPVIFAHRLARSRVRLFEPRDDERRFRFELTVRDVVVRQRVVEGILVRDERHWNVIASRR